MLLKRLLKLVMLSALCLSCAQGDLGGTGGSNGTGGSTSTGGTTGTGGSTSTGGTTSTGGGVGTGGLVGTGGTTHTGGATGTGGVTSTGGVAGTGGTTGTGGVTSTGGNSATGGAAGHGTGGVTSTGGVVGTGGTTATGGSGGAATGGFVENAGASCASTAAPLLSADNKKLPNPFVMHDGTMMTSKSQWECRRNEIKTDLEKYEIYTKQDPGTVAATLSGKTLTVKITTTSGTMSLTSAITGSGSCVLIGLDTFPSLVTGCTIIPFTSNQVVQNMQNSNQYQTDPFYKVYPSLWGKIGNYSAWSWGISRLIDGIVQVASQLNVDPTKIAVHGCSYAGKMALFGGALDERVALTVVEESGGGGIDSWRMSQEFTDRTGTQVEKIDNTNYAWFMSSMKSLDPYKLPHDHHELIGMIAPRAVIILGNPGYDWLGDESGYKSTLAAVEMFKAMGVADHIGYDFTGGHSHCGPPAAQTASVATFVNRFLKGTSTSSNVAIKPTGTSFNLDETTAIDWTTPTLN